MQTVIETSQQETSQQETSQQETSQQETSPQKLLRLSDPLPLESGKTLTSVEVAYNTYGRLNEARDNVVWVCHALTGSSDAPSWWESLIGEGKVLDTEKYFVVCANMLGSCYGSTGPTHTNAQTGSPWFSAFPLVTIADQVRVFRRLREHLGVTGIELLIGGSMGGQQVLEWALQEPDFVRRIAPVATNAKHSPWGIAFNAAQRMALEADATFATDVVDGGQNGLAAARAIGMLSYRTWDLFNARQRELEERIDGYRADSYQRYQGQKLVQRFSAHAYHALTRTMDSHDIGRGRGGIGAALRAIKAKALVIGINSDLLFPEVEQHFLADMIPHSMYRQLKSIAGHDAFLIDQSKVAAIIQQSRILE